MQGRWHLAPAAQGRSARPRPQLRPPAVRLRRGAGDRRGGCALGRPGGGAAAHGALLCRCCQQRGGVWHGAEGPAGGALVRGRAGQHTTLQPPPVGCTPAHPAAHPAALFLLTLLRPGRPPQVYYLAARQVKAQLRLGLSHLHAPAGSINVDAWGVMALQVAQHVRAGSRLQVHGALRQDSWVDKHSGERQWMVKVRPAGACIQWRHAWRLLAPRPAWLACAGVSWPAHQHPSCWCTPSPCRRL